MAAGAVPNPTLQQGPPPGVSLAPPMPQPPAGVTLAPALPAPPSSAPVPTQAAQAQANQPVSAWQALKNAAIAHMEANLSAPSVDVPVLGQLNDIGRGIAKEGLHTIGGLAQFGAKMAGDLGSKSNVQDYLDNHPQASQLEAYNAVNSPTNGAAPYRSADHQAHAAALQKTADWFNQNADTHGFFEGLGGAGENIAELMGGEGLMKLAPELGTGDKVAGIAEKLQMQQKLAKFLGDNPKVAKLMALGMRTAHAAAEAGGASGAQTFVKSGGDMAQTGTAAALGAAGGAVLSPALEGAGSLIRSLSPEVQRIAGEDVPILKSQITRTAPDGTPIRPSTLQEIAASRSNSPEIVGQQQAAAARTIRTEAQNVLERELNAGNAPRTVSAADSPNAAGTADAQGVVAEPSPLDQSPAPSTDTSDPALIAGNPQLGDGQAGLATRETGLATRTGLEPAQPGGNPGSASVEDTSAPGLGGGQPTPRIGAGAPGQPAPFQLKPIDVKSAIATTHDFGDAADHLHEAGRAVYQRLNEVTGGQWQAADQRIQSLQSKYQKAIGPERDAIGRDLQVANKQMDKMFASGQTGISPENLSAAKRMWRSGYVLRDLHNALEPAYQVDADFARKTGTYRGFNGGLALNRLRGQLRKNPDLRPLIGSEAADNMQQIFHYNVTMAGRQRFGEGASAIAKWVADHGDTGVGAAGAGAGALIGGKAGAAATGFASEGIYQALKLVLHKAATDPQVGKNLLYAIEGGARPENYGPLIGRMVLKGTQKYGIPLAAGAAARSM